ncbi:MAG: hypothetical protein HY816_03840 [Candidatus Wallbacteria bacterium]|nr:hypothetical protein [Candidatus Wallbacteria bacterium]
MAVERLYLETSVWNFLLVEDAPERRAATERFFQILPARRWEIAISELVIDEITATRDENRRIGLLAIIHRAVSDHSKVAASNPACVR